MPGPRQEGLSVWARFYRTVASKFKTSGDYMLGAVRNMFRTALESIGVLPLILRWGRGLEPPPRAQVQSSGPVLSQVYIDPTHGCYASVRDSPINVSINQYMTQYLSLCPEDAQQETGIPGVPGQFPRCDVAFGDKERPLMPHVKHHLTNAP